MPSSFCCGDNCCWLVESTLCSRYSHCRVVDSNGLPLKTTVHCCPPPPDAEAGTKTKNYCTALCLPISGKTLWDLACRVPPSHVAHPALCLAKGPDSQWSEIVATRGSCFHHVKAQRVHIHCCNHTLQHPRKHALKTLKALQQ